MAYNMNRDTYTCDFCEFDIAWNTTDKIHGEMWGCEKCGKNFCSKCFEDRFGYKRYMNMMQDSDEIYCPDCYEKEFLSEDKF